MTGESLAQARHDTREPRAKEKRRTSDRATSAHLCDVFVLDVRDPNSLTPLLKEFKPGDSVYFKLRRGEDYLTLPLTLGKGDAQGAPKTSSRAK